MYHLRGMWSSQIDHLESQEHEELMNRLRKTLYYGGLKMPKCKVFTKPMTELVTQGTQPEILGQIKASPCSLIMALIYLDMLNELDSSYARRVPPSDLLLVAMVIDFALSLYEFIALHFNASHLSDGLH